MLGDWEQIPPVQDVRRFRWIPLSVVVRSISRLILTDRRPFRPSLKRVREPVTGRHLSVYCAISDRPIFEPSRPQVFPETLFCGDTNIPTTRVGYYGGPFPANRCKKALDSELHRRQRCGDINISTEALSLNQLLRIPTFSDMKWLASIPPAEMFLGMPRRGTPTSAGVLLSDAFGLPKQRAVGSLTRRCSGHWLASQLSPLRVPEPNPFLSPPSPAPLSFLVKRLPRS